MPGTLLDARDTGMCKISPCQGRAHSLAGISEFVTTAQGTKQGGSCERAALEEQRGGGS